MQDLGEVFTRQIRSMTDGLHEEDLTEPVPTKLNTIEQGRFLAVSKDMVTVRYIGRGNHLQDVGAIRTDWPCPQHALVYYFEVNITSSGMRGAIAVGLADTAFPVKQQVSEPKSYAYHGCDGRLYVDFERGEEYGPRFATGDIIGCGVLTERREIFFTKNGAHLGVAFSNITAVMYPTIRLHSPGEQVTLNLGGEPFVFDIDSLVVKQRCLRHQQALATPPPIVEFDALVRSYLLHMNYGETHRALETAPREDTPPMAPARAVVLSATAAANTDAEPDSKTTIAPKSGKCTSSGSGGGRGSNMSGDHIVAPTPDVESMRKDLCSGLVLEAVMQIEQLFPELLVRHPYLHFRLRCQYFIELLRAKRSMDALRYAQADLTPYQIIPPIAGQSVAAELADVFSLIAYEHSAAEAIAGRLGCVVGSAHCDEFRDRTATSELLNAAVVEKNGIHATCAIERLLRQLFATAEASCEGNFGYSDTVRLD